MTISGSREPVAAELADAFAGLLDDAAMFPPGELPLEAAIPAYARHRAAWYAGSVGSFVFPAPRLGELPAVLGGRSVELSVTIPGGPAAVPTVVRQVGEIDGVRAAALEVALPPGTGVDGLIEALDEAVPEELLLYIEVPRDERGPSVLAALAGTRHRAKLRTGGLVPEAHPSERELAQTIASAVSFGVAFKCTAGLHHAVRHTDGDLEQHGFLNVLLATAAAEAGADATELSGLLAERSARTVTRRIRELGRERLAAARSRFTSFGTCSISDPVGDLVALGLVTPPSANVPAAGRPATDPPSSERSSQGER